MKSELAKKHTKFDELVKRLESDPEHREGLEQARRDVKAFFDEMNRRAVHVNAALRAILLEEFVEDLEIKAPGQMADRIAKLLTNPVMRMLNDEELTRVVPMSTETKVEL